MKKITLVAGLALIIAGAVFVGITIADTSFDWSGAQNTGTLTYTGLSLSKPIMTVATDTITDNDTIAVGGTYVQLTAATAITNVGIANASAAGQLLILENVSTNSITIADNGQTVAIGAAVALGTDDTLTLIANAAAEWRELATANN